MGITKLTVLVACSILGVCLAQGAPANYPMELACAGQSMRLECRVGTIHLIETFFGYNPTFELEEPCPGTPPARYCKQTSNAYRIMSDKCQGEQSCNVTADDEFQDPCGSRFVKYLRVYYNCYNPKKETTAPTTPTPKILVEESTLAPSLGNFTGQGPDSTRERTSTCSDCLVWKICTPILVVFVVILVCVIVFMAKGKQVKDKKEVRQEQQL